MFLNLKQFKLSFDSSFSAPEVSNCSPFSISIYRAFSSSFSNTFRTFLPKCSNILPFFVFFSEKSHAYPYFLEQALIYVGCLMLEYAMFLWSHVKRWLIEINLTFFNARSKQETTVSCSYKLQQFVRQQWQQL